MKKQILSLALTVAAIFSGVVLCHAQSTTGTTTLHVKIIDALNITVNNSDVTLTFDDPNDYILGRDTTLNSHLTVTSNQAFDVKVKSASSNLSDGASHTIAVSGVTVTIPAGQTGLGTLTAHTLTTSDQTLILGATAAVSKDINVEYSIPPSVSNTSAILGKPAGDYTTTLTYTIAAN